MWSLTKAAAVNSGANENTGDRAEDGKVCSLVQPHSIVKVKQSLRTGLYEPSMATNGNLVWVDILVNCNNRILIYDLSQVITP
jgi:hypothetical protein